MKEVFKDGQTILFQGDSVTDCGRDRADILSLANGYAGQVASMYKACFPQNTARFINKGVGGDQIEHLLSRYEKDIKDIKPDFISIMIGINDTLRRYEINKTTGPELFESRYRKLLNMIREDFPDIKIMLIEPMLLHPRADNLMWYEDLDPKILIIQKLAFEFADYYMPTNGLIRRELVQKKYPDSYFTNDGVHPTPVGHGFIAYNYLDTLGVFN